MITDNIGYMFLRLLRAWVHVLRAFYFLNHEVQITISLFTLVQSHFCLLLLFIARQFPLQKILFLLFDSCLSILILNVISIQPSSMFSFFETFSPTLLIINFTINFILFTFIILSLIKRNETHSSIFFCRIFYSVSYFIRGDARVK
jgi:hypothetical protein